MPQAARGRVMNIGGGRAPTTINELHAAISELAGSNVDPERVPTREGDIRRSEADVSLARELIGYEPAVDVAEGVRRTVEWFAGRHLRSA
jgi:nucleoside-diphosphate-sugar epimerase